MLTFEKRKLTCYEKILLDGKGKLIESLIMFLFFIPMLSTAAEVLKQKIALIKFLIVAEN